MKAAIAQADVVVTTAQVFGRPAPRIVGADMVAGMRPGSVIVDMAVETGGNVEGSKVGEVVDVNGVKIIGLGNLPSEVAQNASEMFSANLFNLVDEFWDGEAKSFGLDLEDDILKTVSSPTMARSSTKPSRTWGRSAHGSGISSFILMLSIFLGFELISSAGHTVPAHVRCECDFRHHGARGARRCRCRQ